MKKDVSWIADLSISVSDRGIGFPDADRAFQAFFTTKANGMGIGLIISNSIIDALGGRLQVMPKQDIGTVASLSMSTGQK